MLVPPPTGLLLFHSRFQCLPFAPADRGENLVEEVHDIKDLKKILKTRKNVLVLFAESGKSAQKLLDLCRQVALAVKGTGSLFYVNCGAP